MKLTKEEKTKYLDAVCKGLFKKKYADITDEELLVLELNLLTRKRYTSENEQYVFDEIMKVVKKDEPASDISSDYNI